MDTPMTSAKERAVEAGARAISEMQLAGVNLHEWLLPCSKGDCEALGIIWPEHPHDRHREISDCQIEMFTEQWTKAALRAAFPILANELVAWHDERAVTLRYTGLMEAAAFHTTASEILRARIQQMAEAL